MAEPGNPDRELRDASDVDSIQSLDTARMTLRWALERLRAMEKLNKELEAKSEWEFKMRMKAESDFKALLEHERAHLTEVQRQREAEIEKRFAAKLAEWERGYQAAQEEHGRRAAELARKEEDFDKFCALQKEGAESERRRVASQARRDAEERLRTLQRQTEDRIAELSEAWRKEREAILRELEAR